MSDVRILNFDKSVEDLIKHHLEAKIEANRQLRNNEFDKCIEISLLNVEFFKSMRIKFPGISNLNELKNESLVNIALCYYLKKEYERAFDAINQVELFDNYRYYFLAFKLNRFMEENDEALKFLRKAYVKRPSLELEKELEKMEVKQ